MFCIKCGKENDEGNRFCIYCGQDLSDLILPEAGEKAADQKSDTPRERDEEKKTHSGAVLILIIALCAAAVVTVFFLWKKTRVSEAELEGAIEEVSEALVETSKDPETETSAEWDSEQEITEDSEEEASEISTAQEDTLGNMPEEQVKEQSPGEGFQIDPDTIADYNACLDPSAYVRYDPDMALFGFSYPTALFNRVEVDDENHEIVLGNQIAKNARSVQFYASDGSETLFQVMNRTQVGGIDPKLGEIYDAENQIRFNGTGDGGLHYEDGYGWFYLSGWQNGSVIYEYVRMDDNQIYRFFMIQPPWQDLKDRAEKEYVLTCMERLTKYSVHKDIPSYEEFLEKNAERFGSAPTAALYGSDGETGDSGYADSAWYSVVVSAPDSYVNLRTGPGTGCEILTAISNGVVLKIQDSIQVGTSWWMKTTYQGMTGWIAASQVTITDGGGI